jgi:hypothetical protein
VTKTKIIPEQITRANVAAMIIARKIEVAMKGGAWWTIRLNGQIQRWKRDPKRIRIPYKYGLRGYGEITEKDFVAPDSADLLFFLRSCSQSRILSHQKGRAMITLGQVKANPQEACSMIATLEGEIKTHEALRRGLLKSYNKLREQLEKLIGLCENGDFKNGVTDATGTIDEGDVTSDKIIVEARELLKGLYPAHEFRIVLDTRLQLVNSPSYDSKHRAAYFVEIEDEFGKSIDAGSWVKRPDGLYEIVIANGIVVTRGAT